MVILVDASVWIDYVRDAPTRATGFVIEHVGADLAVSEPVLMELLAGASPGRGTSQLQRLLMSQLWCGVDSTLDFHGAVEVYQATRATGHQPRLLIDCLLAAIALRRAIPVAHRDRDFARIAAATGLEVVDLR